MWSLRQRRPAGGKGMPAGARLLPDMHDDLASRADSLPRRQFDHVRSRQRILLVVLDPLHPRLVSLVNGTLRMDSCSGVAFMAADGTDRAGRFRIQRRRSMIQVHSILGQGARQRCGSQGGTHPHQRALLTCATAPEGGTMQADPSAVTDRHSAIRAEPTRKAEAAEPQSDNASESAEQMSG